MTFKLDQFAQARLDHHTLFLAFVQQLLLSLSQGFRVRHRVFLETILVDGVLRPNVHLRVDFAILQRGVERGPGRHEELLLVGTNIDHAVFVFHQVLKARRCVEYRRNGHWRRGVAWE